MFTELMASGSGGGSGESTVYWFTYYSATYYLFKNGEKVVSGWDCSYEDENISWLMSGHTCTLLAKTDIRLQLGATATPTFIEYSAGDYIYNGQTNFYGLMPICLQIMHC